MTLIEMIWWGLWTFLGAMAGWGVTALFAPGHSKQGKLIGGACGFFFAFVCIPMLFRLWDRRKKKKGSEPDSPANGSQPIRSDTNRTSSAAGSRR